MRTETIKIFKFSELSERAQRRAFEESPDFSSEWGSDYRATLAAFEDVFDIKVYRWNVDDYGHNYSYVTVGRATEAPEGDALRLARYMWNNYADAITRGKCYGTRGRWIEGKYHYKHRYSRVTVEIGQYLTGFYADLDILAPVVDCLHYREMFDSYADLIDACLDRFFRAWAIDIEYHSSFDYFAELADANNWEFTETGEFWK